MGLADSTVTYNGVTIRNCLTRMFEQENVLDESGTDTLFYRFRLSVVGYIHLHANANSKTKITGPNAESGSIATQHRAIRAKLMENRKDFLFSVGNIELLRATASTDVNNGPHPQKFDIIHIGGIGMLRVSFTIEICKVECGGSDVSGESLGVLSNRWSINEDFDHNWFATRTVRGRLRVASISLNPQAFRGWVVPPLQRGFKRQRMSFTTATNGLELEYEITDQQVFAAAPNPAKSWTASHVESTTDGVNAFGSVAVRVEGHPGVDKRELVSLAAKICEARLKLRESSGNFLLEGVEITDPLNEAAIEMRIRVRHLREVQSYFGMIGDLMGKPLSSDDLRGDEYDQFTSPVPTSSDLTSPTGLFICYLQTPCSPDHSIQQSTDEPPDEEYGGEEGSETPEISESTGTLSTYIPSWSEENFQAVYTYYRLENHYLSDALRVQLPVAQFSSGSESLDSTSIVARLGAGVGQRLVIVDAERANDWPKMPAISDFEDATGTNKLLTTRIVSLAPKLGADGATFVYGLRGAYLFAMQRMPSANDFAGSIMPYIDAGAAANGKPLTSDDFTL